MRRTLTTTTRAALSPATPRITAGGGVSYDTDAQTYITAVEAADGQSLETGVKDAINAFVVGCKSDGIWAAIKASCILAGARTLTGALVPLVGTAPTNNNFVSGDYSRTVGLTGNGSTKYLNSNRANNADPQDSQHLAAFVTVADTTLSANPGLIGTGGDVGGESVIGYITTTQNYFIRSRSSGIVQLATQARGTGLHAISRNSSGSVSSLISGVSTSSSLASITPNSSTVKVLARDATPYWNGAVAFYSIGESLDLALLDTRVTNLITAIGAAIP